MLLWSRRRGIIMGDDPPYLVVGTEVSAKYKGAFCEAKVRKVVRSVKCKVTFKLGLGTAIITDDQIRGTLRVGATCEAKHPEKKEFLEATINKIQDCSQYTVVFDDGDITTLRRTALCLKSGRHFAESETLDQLPLTHPEHFSNPVIGGRKGRRSRQAHDDSSEEEETPKKGKQKEEKEADIGKVVCVELGDKKKQKDNWFPGLVVAPTAQDTVRIRVRDEYLVRSFKDGRYFTVPKKEATQFTREIGSKVDNHTLKAAVEKALMYLDKDELPPHWDRDLLFGLDESSGNSDSDAGFDSDSSDDEPREEKDHFVAQLYKFMDDRGTPINKGPTIGSKDVDLYKLFKVVHKLGGYNRVTNHNQWKTVAHKIGFGTSGSSVTNLVKQSYKKFLHSFEDFYRKLGCTMVNHPRGHRSRHRGGRSLIRDCDRATPVHINKEKPVTPVTTASITTSAFPVVSVASTPTSVTSSIPSSSCSTVCTTSTVGVSVDAAPKLEVAEKLVAVPAKLSSEKASPSRKPCATVCSKDAKPITDLVSLPEEVTCSQKSSVIDIVSEKVSCASRSVGSGISISSNSTGSNSSSSAKVTQNSESVKLKVEPEQSQLENSKTESKTLSKLEVVAVPKVEKHDACEKEEKHNSTVKVDPKIEVTQVSEIPKKQLEEKEERVHLRKAKKEEKFKEKETRGRMREPVCEVKPLDEASEPAILAPCVEKVLVAQDRVKQSSVAVSKPKLREGGIKLKGKLKKDISKRFPMKVVTSDKIILRKKFKLQPMKEGKVKPVQEKKLDEPKKKIEKKPEEEEKQTRSKSKEDARALKKEAPPPERKLSEVKVPVRDTRTPVRETVERMERRPRETRTPVRDTRTPVREIVERKLLVRDAGEKKLTTREVIEKKLAIRDAAEKKALAKDSLEKKAVLRECGEKKAMVRESERRPSVREIDKKIAPRELDKKTPVRLKKPEEQSPPLLQKKRGRKRRDAEDNPLLEENLGLLPSHIRVGVGDKLKVYYGPTQESKVTYEAKVLEVEVDSSETMYLVHYTGWNTRYDEWIKRGRIAENLSWTPARAKRLQHQGSRSKVSKSTMGKRSRPSLSGHPQETGGSQPPRSTTPSSVTSCSSRTKSPATPTTPHLPLRRTLRNTSAESLVPGFDFRRRTRRSSGFTDISVASMTETEDEDDDVDVDDDEEEVDSILVHDAEQENASPSELVSVSDRSKRETETEQLAQKKVPRKDEDIASKNDEIEPDELEEKRRPRRSKKRTPESTVLPNNLAPSLAEGLDEEQKEKKIASDVKAEGDSSNVVSRGVGLNEEEQQPIGRDFDLNQIRSELKGIERAVTLEPDDALVLPTEDQDNILPILSPAKVSEENIIKTDSFDSVGIIEIIDNSSSKDDDNCDSSTEDVYEFKEPEPFEFEVRTKRELQEGRRTGRIFDDVVESKNDKFPFPRKRPRAKVESLLPLEGEVKRRYRRTVGRKMVHTTELRRETESEQNEQIVVEVSKSLPNTTYEDVFDKLCQVKKSCEDGKPSETDDLGPLSLFGELPGESQDDECEEDSDDRLVISEAEETTVEGEGPLFSHSKLFPNLMSSEPPALVLESESSQILNHKTQEPQKQSLVPEANIFSGVFKTSDEKHHGILEQQDKDKSVADECIAKEHDNVVSLLLQPKLVEDFEEDPINAAIQRVFERSLTDEDSSQDIFGEKSQTDNFQLILNSKETVCTRKPTLEEDVLSDSSDEESRLIIATKDNEDVECLGESREETASKDGPSEEHRPEDDESTQDAVEVVENALTVCCAADYKEDSEGNSGSLKMEDNVKVKEQNQAEKTSVLKAWLQDSMHGESWLYSSEKSQDLNIKVEETVKTHEHVVKQETSDIRHSEDVELKPVHSVLMETALGKSVPDHIEPAETRTLGQLHEEPLCSEQTKEQQEEPTSLQDSVLEVVVEEEEAEEDEDEEEEEEEAVRENVAPVLEPEAGKIRGEDMDTGLCSLLCEETIPGSPPTLTAEEDITPEDDKVMEMPFASAPGSNCAPSSVFTPVDFPTVGGRSLSSPSQAPAKRISGEAAPVLDNTPPATPTSSLSTASGSPRDEPERLTPTLEHDSKFHQNSFNLDLENRMDSKTGNFSEEDSLLNVDMSSSNDARLGKKCLTEKEKESGDGVGKKRRHSRRRSECESKRGRHISSRIHMGGSDSDDTSENSAAGSMPLINTTDSLVSRSPRPSKYNFYVELDPDMDGSQRIALLQQNLQELRKAYMAVKAELACIDRRRKKLRRREREEKALKQEVSCS